MNPKPKLWISSNFCLDCCLSVLLLALIFLQQLEAGRG
ncbi:hypothetical protein SLEP1_g52985 [Rubroshorea leprosula]|uniref:Uncharacterized protein n=1 Tax=Rubroshorea leprosula TaxID=152421 RepID=A0AAV5M849_9ROSI|nr:hypothetical protein SLEP1_g52985 [Rubroshorea leprosula]